MLQYVPEENQKPLIEFMERSKGFTELTKVEREMQELVKRISLFDAFFRYSDSSAVYEHGEKQYRELCHDIDNSKFISEDTKRKLHLGLMADSKQIEEFKKEFSHQILRNRHYDEYKGKLVYIPDSVFAYTLYSETQIKHAVDKVSKIVPVLDYDLAFSKVIYTRAFGKRTNESPVLKITVPEKLQNLIFSFEEEISRLDLRILTLLNLFHDSDEKQYVFDKHYSGENYYMLKQGSKKIIFKLKP